MVINPKGEVIAQANIDDEFIDAEIDIELVNKWRKEFPVLGDIRDLHNL
jgi:predicted amidohydrolase